MQESLLTRQMEHWGYYLLPKSHPQCPGYAGLLVAVRDLPTEMHFDPEVLQVRFSDQADLGWATLKRHSTFEGERHVLAGRIILSDRLDKRIEFFTFGARLMVESTPHAAVFSFASTVPILDLTDETGSTANQMASETDDILAHWKAHFAQHEDLALAQLALVEPIILYVATIQSLLRHYDRRHELREAHRLTYSTLVEERNRLEENGQWQMAIPASIALSPQE